jgi:hypothetical protein
MKIKLTFLITTECSLMFTQFMFTPTKWQNNQPSAICDRSGDPLPGAISGTKTTIAPTQPNEFSQS